MCVAGRIIKTDSKEIQYESVEKIQRNPDTVKWRALVNNA